MLYKVSWRNIWRNKLRSLVVIISVGIGLWAGMFAISFSWGLYTEHIHDVIQTQLSHIQIHNPSFMADKMVDFTISDGNNIIAALKQDPKVKGVAGRSLAEGMISSPTSTAGVLINGVRPEEEKKVSSIFKDVITGSYLPETGKPEILIGEKLANKLDVKIKNKIVLAFQSKGGDITYGSFRIAGIFRTKNSSFDESNAYVQFDDLAPLLGTGNNIHEIAILLQSDTALNTEAAHLRALYPKLQIQTWKQLSPELEIIVDSFYQYMYIFIAIILLALMFGIINTMLMAVLERQHEFGMLMAIGMNKSRIFRMILFETTMLTCTGIPLGVALTYFSVDYFHKTGIDVSSFSQGLASYGFTTVIRPELETNYYLPVIVMTTCAAILSGIYPAIKALKLKPAESIRKI